jgi:hypothetical protein
VWLSSGMGGYEGDGWLSREMGGYVGGWMAK